MPVTSVYDLEREARSGPQEYGNYRNSRRRSQSRGEYNFGTFSQRLLAVFNAGRRMTCRFSRMPSLRPLQTTYRAHVLLVNRADAMVPEPVQHRGEDLLRDVEATRRARHTTTNNGKARKSPCRTLPTS